MGAVTADPALASAEVLAVLSPGVWVGLGVAAWLGLGLVTAVVMGRRGHQFRPNLGLALVLGPLFVPLALDVLRHRDPLARPVVLAPTPRRPGRRAIVAVLGDPESVADALPVLDAYGPIGAVTLVAALDYETAEFDDVEVVRGEAAQRLAAAAVFLPDREPGRVLVPGAAEDAIARLAEAGRHDVIVVTGAAIGASAERISAGSGVPVVVAPPVRGRE